MITEKLEPRIFNGDCGRVINFALMGHGERDDHSWTMSTNDKSRFLLNIERSKGNWEVLLNVNEAEAFAVLWSTNGITCNADSLRATLAKTWQTIPQEFNILSEQTAVNCDSAQVL